MVKDKHTRELVRKCNDLSYPAADRKAFPN